MIWLGRGAESLFFANSQQAPPWRKQQLPHQCRFSSYLCSSLVRPLTAYHGCTGRRFSPYTSERKGRHNSFIPTGGPCGICAKLTEYSQNSQALGVSANWLWNFFVAMIGPTLINDLAWKGYLIFMCFNLVFVPVSKNRAQPSLP